VRVYSDAKVGRDAGALVGLPDTGIVATQDIDAIIAGRPDCVVYMAERAEIDVLARLLSNGINVATSRMEFNGRARMDPEIRTVIAEACARGGASIYASGSTPGWFTEVMPLALSGMERRLECITLSDFADMSSRNSPEMLFGVLPFGRDPATLDESVPTGTAMSSPPSFGMTSAALGLPADEIVTRREYALARQRTTIAAGMIEAGTIAGMRMEIAAVHAGRTVFRRRSVWYLTRDLDCDWDLRDTGLHYRVDGDLPLDVMITIPVSPSLTANPVVNAVPLVCAAAPGIVQTDELPLLSGWFGE
jgi:2,4-diaminopentanoate dehydrogenase